MISPQRRKEIIDSLRRGTVPQRGLDAFAVGLERFEAALDEELASVEGGQGVFKAVRGDYGSGKTFFARWLQEKAKKRGFATSEVQISETDTPLHRLETVYRRLVDHLSTADTPHGAMRRVVDGWFYTLEEDLLASGQVQEADEGILLAQTNDMMEKRLKEITLAAPSLAAALRGYRAALAADDPVTAEGLIAWISGQPNVAAAIKRKAGIKGDMDHFSALSFLQGLLIILRDSGHPGLLLVLDEVETLQRVRTDVRDKGLNALRQFMDEVDAGRFPGLYLLVTGTPAFFDGPQGLQRLPPLAQRMNVDFATDPRFDNPRAVQIRLPNFDLVKLSQVGQNVRELFIQGSTNQERLRRLADDDYLHLLARSVTGHLGGKVGIAPRIFLRKLVGDVLDRIDQFPDFNPRTHYALTLNKGELTEQEQNILAVPSVDDIELSL